MAELASLQSKSKKGSENKAGSGRQRAKPNIPTTVLGQALQAKISVGPARDRFEAEADRVADHVVNGSSGTPAISPLSPSAAQRKTNSKKEDELQRKAHSKKPEDELQRKTKTKKPEDELQREAKAATSANASPNVEAGINAARGSGSPLAPAVLDTMESGFDRDFSSVRIHNDSRSHNLNQSLSSRAFTVGSDIFFSSGEYQPATSRGSLLLAHELTHVVQQSGSGGIQTKRIQRNSDNTQAPAQTDPPTPGPVWTDPNNANRSINLEASPITYKLPSLWIPRIGGKRKGVHTIGSVTGGSNGLLPTSGPIEWTGKGSRAGSSQSAIWETHLRNSQGIISTIEQRFRRAPEIYRGGDETQRVYYVRIRREDRSQVVIIGTAAELAVHPSILRPPWDKNGRFTLMEVDHWREIQLNGSHEIGNMWLLDKEANGESGRKIKTDVVRDLNALLADARRADFFTGSNSSIANFTSWPDNANIIFSGTSTSSLSGKYWDKQDIAEGRHISFLNALTQRELRDEGFVLKSGDELRNINVFLSSQSSFRRRMRVRDGTLDPVGYNLGNFIRGFDLEEAIYTRPQELTDGQQVGILRGVAFGKRKVMVPGPDGAEEEKRAIRTPTIDVPIKSRVDYGYGGYIDRAYINQALRNAAAQQSVQVAGFSPIALESAGLNDEWAMVAEGRVTADNPLFPGFEFAIRAEGDSIYLDAPIPVDRLQFDPFRVTEANLQVGFDREGPFFGGDASFVIDGVGEGSISARRLSLAGNFEFDIDAFDPASIAVAYENGEWSIDATLGFKENVIPGIQSGQVSVSVNEEGFSLSGTANMGGPGIPEGTSLTIAYAPEQGLTIGGDMPINTDAIPGVSSARAAITVTRSSDGEWAVAGTGSAQIELPGVSGSLTVSYDNGLLTIGGEGTVSRPPLTGSVNITTTNAPADEEGNPIEGPPLTTFRVFGSGEASIQFGEYITGTIGITLLENGEIELLGRIELPPEIPLIDERRWDYDILDFPEVRFPIIGLTIPVINKSVGVFGFVRGGLDAVVTVGPGVLRDTAVEASYNPDRPEEASITGRSQFDMTASADVGLSVTGGIGAGLAIIEATGEVGIRAGLGLTLTGGASVEINWTPTQGLAIDASVFGEARPRFSISLIAEAAVVVDAFLWSGTIWSEEWDRELGSFGPDMFWRAELPASWSEQDGLDLDINNLEITQPDIDIQSLASDIFDAVI